MLTQDEVFILEKALLEIEGLAGYLDDLMVPSVPPSGSNAGVTATKGKSKPPVVIPVLDIKDHAEAVVFGWCSCLSDSLGLPVPSEKSLAVRTRWLRLELESVRVCEWASDCLEEVVAEARTIRDLVDPPLSKRLPSLGSDEPRAVARFDQPCSARQAARLCESRGVPVSDRTVSDWAKRGIITADVGELGTWEVYPKEVFAVARDRYRLGRSRLRKSRPSHPGMLRSL
ncbi:hypothetical protein CKALI_11365 [Corynebacterium kalinowskii]|uniref:Uncharacterized protein n=2 Tax=Corynebacterium kalinowskii TaxID=2675216 RepID=A0A6B8VU08_9CORY|nr:hypothetical protein CKALI_11365 [Corynebacterium kalinowskii]